MLSQTNDYALRVMAHLARSGKALQTSPQIAGATGVPPGYLSKVMQVLNRAELVTSQRGLHGGFLLNVDPQAVTALDVVNAVDPLKRIHTCPLKIPSHGTTLCPLHRRIDNAALAVEHLLRQTRISDLAMKSGPDSKECGAASAAVT